MSDVKQEVKEFYNQVGWKLVGEDVYQNARYEDLRPVAREYIHACHARVARHLAPQGRLLLDAGSGPVQYPEYLTYSQNYRYRVCADISFTALVEARRRLGERGLYVVCDVANLPFKADAFDGVVSLHTIHHLPEDEHLNAFRELHRVLLPARQAVVVNGWAHSPWLERYEPLVRFAQRTRHLFERLTGQRRPDEPEDPVETTRRAARKAEKRAKKQFDKNARSTHLPQDIPEAPKGTFTNKHNAEWVRREVGAEMSVEILVWRTVTVRFTRALIHSWLGGRLWLRRLFALEERHPHYYGENGKYPLIVIRKMEK
ncbi:MAG: class I SAM-dependent methyltransferase [Chloroflexota bacterium]